MTNYKTRIEAARIYQETGNASETARRVGIHRATMMRWLKDPDFLTAADNTVPVQEEGEIGLKMLVPKAMDLLNQALAGNKVTPTQLKAAMEVLKATNALKESARRSATTLESRLAELDSKYPGESD